MNMLLENGFSYDSQTDSYTKNLLVIPHNLMSSVLDESMLDGIIFLAEEKFWFKKDPCTATPQEGLVVSNGKKDFDFFEVVASEYVFKDFVTEYLKEMERLEN